MRSKKAQASEAIKYLLITAMIISITFFGYYSILKFNNNLCQNEIIQFSIKMEDLQREVKFNQIEEKSIQVPCGADAIFLVDLDQDINPDDLLFSPLVQDSVVSKAKKNLFVLEKNDILESLYVGNITINPPGYLCMETQREKVAFTLEGKGRNTKIMPQLTQPTC